MIDLSADARVKLARLLSNIGLDMDKQEAEKANFLKTVLRNWDNEAKERESKLNK
ncbi:hypothetical protein TUM4261_40370 [Shewanella sp. c952]|nr:hypothetical protein TUM4261_40370 [Shewanella sp. c952]